MYILDLIQRQKPNNSAGNFSGSVNFMKSPGVGGSRFDFSFLAGKWVVVSLISLAAALTGFGAIKGYSWYLDKKTSDLKEATESLKSGENAQLAEKVGDVEKISRLVEALSGNHIFTSLFFAMIEKFTLPEISWQTVSLDTAQGVAEMHGQAASYSSLARQILNFEKEKIQIAVSGISLGKEGVGFSAKLKFDPALLKLLTDH